jgi:membrane protease YdiL (CAAX protease family)
MMSEKRNRKNTRNIVGLILLLLLPIGASAIVGIAVTTLAYPGEAEPTFTYFMTHPWPGLLFAAITEATLAITIYRTRGKRVFEHLPEISTSGHELRELLLGVAIGGGAIALATLALAVFGVYRPLGFGSVQGILVGFAAGLGAGVAEELLFRGVILRLTHAKWGAFRAIIFTSLLFGAVHFGNDLSVAEVIGVFVAAGLLLNGVWFLTKRIWVCIGTHFAWNFFLGGIFGMTVSGIPMTNGGLIQSKMTGSDLMTGGVSGPEASLLFVITVALVGAIVLLIALKRRNTLEQKK